MTVKATRSFVPALNKEGLSKLTLVDFSYKEGDKVDNETGETRHWELFQIQFECKAKYRGMEAQKVSITTGVKYSPDNALGKSLKKLGLDVDNDIEITFDNDGFEVEAISNEVDDDGFEDTDTPADIDIESLVTSRIGHCYKARVTRGKNGFWGIDLDSLEGI